MDKKILELEKSLFELKYMSDKKYLNNIIDDNYEELGKSGKIFSKDDVINELSNLKSNRNIVVYNYSCKELCEDLWLIHYLTKSKDKVIYRTSIWKRNNNEIKIIFHQASEYKEVVELLQY